LSAEQTGDERFGERGQIIDGVGGRGVRHRFDDGLAKRVCEDDAPTFGDEIDGGREVARLDATGEQLIDRFLACAV
jgi:hypothetical protein